METDAALVQRVLAGETDAYGELARRHERALLAAAGAVLGDLHAAQDAAQEALRIAYQRLASLRKAGAFGAWTVRIARRVAITMWRKNGRTRSLGDEADTLAASVGGMAAGGDPPDDKPLDDEIQQLFRAVMRLPEKQRQVVLLRYFAGHSNEAISTITAQPVGTVRSRLSRGLAMLRRRLRGLEP
jgi:RNA polymerase sigma-70 factor (ECF subfamily)